MGFGSPSQRAQMYYHDVDTGLVTPSQGHDGAPTIVLYTDAIGQGKVAGHTKFRGFGERMACSTAVTGDDIWAGTATTLPIPDQTIGEQMTLVSTSIQDDSTGTGVRSIDIHGLDATGNPVSEVIALDGTTPVNTVRTNWRFIQAIHGESWGIDLVAAGLVTIYRTGDATRIYNQIAAGTNASLNIARMVPAGKTAYIKNVSCSGASNKSIAIRLRITSTFEDVLIPEYAFQFKDCMFMQNSGNVKDYPCPITAPALSVIKLTAWSLQAGGDVAASFGGWYE